MLNSFLLDYNALQEGQAEITLDVSTYSTEEISSLWGLLAESSRTEKLTLYSRKSAGTLLPSASSLLLLSPSISSHSSSPALVSKDGQAACNEQEEVVLPPLSPVLVRATSRLTYLDLSSNLLSEHFLLDLCQVLARNHTLRSLDLGYNLIGDLGANALASIVLPSNTALQVLILVGNQITNAGARELVWGLKYNSSLRDLYLLGNRIDEAWLARVDEAVAHVQIKHSILALRACQGGKRASPFKRLPSELARLVLAMLV